MHSKKIFSIFGLALLLTLTFAGTALAADNFLVIFMSDDDVYLQKPVARYARVSVPEQPVKDGYVFDGWYTEAECVNKFDFDTRIPSKTIVYAKWTPATGYSANGSNADSSSDLPEFKIPGFGVTLGVAAIIGAALIFGRKKNSFEKEK